MLPSEPSIKDTETWLDWQAHRLDMPCWWTELTAIPVVEDPQKLTWNIWASFSIPEIRSRVFLGQGYTAPPAPKCLTQNVFLLDELSYQEVWQQPFLLTETHARGLQYWAEVLNLPVDPDFWPLVRSVLEVKEMVKEHVVFSKEDVTQGLRRINLRNRSQWPQTTPTNIGSGESSNAGAREACVTTPPSYGSIPVRRHTAVPPTRPWMEDNQLGRMPALLRQPLKLPLPPCQGSAWPVQSPCPIRWRRRGDMCWVVTALIRRLNLEMTGVVLGDTVTALPDRSAFQNPCMAAVLSGRVINNQGTTVKELDDKWGPPQVMSWPITTFGWKSRMMTTFRQKGSDTTWHKQLYWTSQF